MQHCYRVKLYLNTVLRVWIDISQQIEDRLALQAQYYGTLVHQTTKVPRC
jgi:hypothetical protein